MEIFDGYELTFSVSYISIDFVLERWLSGLKRLPAKKVSSQKGLRGFKSLSLRQSRFWACSKFNFQMQPHL